MKRKNAGPLLFMTLFLSVCWPVLAQEFGVGLGEKINVRDKPASTGKVIGQITGDLEPVTVINADCGREKIKSGDQELDCPWIQVSTAKVKSGYVFGNFMEVFSSKERADNFIAENLSFRKKWAGSWKLVPTKSAGQEAFNFQVTLKADGNLEMAVDAVEGDHLIQEKGAGRFYLYPEAGVVKLFAILQGEFAPDGMSWEEYYKLGHTGQSPSKAEIEAFRKEREKYSIRREFMENILSLDTVLKKLP